MRTTLFPIRRLALSVSLGLLFASVVGVAGAASDVTEIEIRANGKTERVVLDDMHVGESRQLYSESGTRVTAMRTADAIELDIDGEKTRVALHDELPPDVIAALADADSGDGGKHVVRLRRVGGDIDIDTGIGVDIKRDIVLVTGDGASVHTLDGDEDISVLLDDIEGDADGESRRVIVKRHVIKADDDAPAK